MLREEGNDEVEEAEQERQLFNSKTRLMILNADSSAELLEAANEGDFSDWSSLAVVDCPRLAAGLMASVTVSTDERLSRCTFELGDTGQSRGVDCG